MEGLIVLSGRICDFELIKRKDLKEQGYKYMEKVSGIFYKENQVDFGIPKDEDFTRVKLTFSNGKEAELLSADIDSIVPTYKRTFTIYMYKNLIPKVYENVIKIEIK